MIKSVYKGVIEMTFVSSLPKEKLDKKFDNLFQLMKQDIEMTENFHITVLPQARYMVVDCEEDSPYINKDRILICQFTHKIITYTRGEAIKKANMFRGTPKLIENFDTNTMT